MAYTFWMQYLSHEANKLTFVELSEVINSLSNWTYLHLSFMEEEPTRAQLEVLMFAEIQNKNRAQILRRLYSRWQKAIRAEHHEEMGI